MEELAVSRVDDDRREKPEDGRASRPIVAIIIATAVLYFAKDIFIPLAIASLLAVIFSSVAGRLERFLGRFIGSALVVIVAISIVVSIGYFVTLQLTSVAVRVTDYTDNIANKIAALQGGTPFWLQRVEDGVKDVQQRLHPPIPSRIGASVSTSAQVPSKESDFNQITKPLLPVLSGVFEGLIDSRAVFLPAIRST